MGNQAIQNLERILKLQKEAFIKNPNPSAKERIELMSRIPKMLKKNREKILDALEKDFCGHSRQQGDLLEILGMFDRAKYNISNVKKWMKPIKKSVNMVTLGSSKAFLKYHPKGVIGNMVSWNFPFDIALGPTLDNLAAGNKVIIKPSDLSPACGELLQEMISHTFDEDQVAVVNGGLDLARHFSTLKWDHLVYTGSGVVGKKIMESAAKNLVPVTLELGGKSPAIIDKNAVNDKTIADIAAVKVVKRGQMCVTVNYCLVPKEEMNTFVSKMTAFLKAHFEQDNATANSCGIITQKHLTRLQALVNEAKENGVEIIQIGKDLDGSNRNMPFYIAVNPPLNIGLMKEEIFGPILPIVSYETKQEAINFINSNERPLGLYIYSKNKEFIKTITENTRSGGVSINSSGLQAAQPSLPFGGIGESGMGYHHGIEAFKGFSNPRGYFIKGKGGSFEAFSSPYGKETDTLINDAGYASIGKQLVFALKTLPKNIWAMIRSQNRNKR